MFEFPVEIGGIELLALVFGLVEFFKAVFGLEGKAVTVLSAVLGGIMMAVYQALPMLPPEAQPIVHLVILSLAFGLAASGFYKWSNARFPKIEEFWHREYIDDPEDEDVQ